MIAARAARVTAGLLMAHVLWLIRDPFAAEETGKAFGRPRPG